MIKNYISDNISYLSSKEKELTQDEFGNLFGLKRGSINSYINNKSTPKIETLIKICEHYNLTLDELVRSDLLEKIYRDAGGEKSRYVSEVPEGYGLINLKYVELLEKSNEDKDKIIIAYEQKLLSDK